VLETLLAFRRAGASTVLTYYASEVASWYQGGLPAHLREFS
jgi:porphobilinogen synthase